MEQIVLCDTNVLIELYRNNGLIIAELKRIGQPNLAVSAITAGELYFGARNKAELSKLEADLTSIKTYFLNEAISILALDLLTSFSLSHRLGLPDAFIAATALFHDLPLFTLNIKDFHYIPGVRLWRLPG